MEDGEEIGTIKRINTYEVQWIIEDFFSYTGADKYYRSPNFHNSGVWWYLQIYPNGENRDKSVGWVSLFLYRDFEEEEHYNPKPESACFTFGVKKTDGKTALLGSECSWIFLEDFSGFGLGGLGNPKLLDRSVLQRRRSELATPGGTVSFTCTLRTMHYFESSGRFDPLFRDFTDLFNSKRGSDATLVVKGKEFAVHKTILSARSSVFAAMFEADNEDKRTGRFEIEDCDLKIFGDFLTYLYTGKAEKKFLESRNPIELYKVAHKYNLPDLKSYCRLSVMYELWDRNINVLEAYKFGHLFNEHEVMLVAKEFFKKYYSKSQFTRWVSWQTFEREHTALAKDLLNGATKEMRMERTKYIHDVLKMC